MRNKSTLLSLLPFLLLGFGGCAADLGPPGQVAVAIVGTDANGAIYTLPSGSYLEVAGGDFDDTFSLDESSSTVSITVPARSYDTVSLGSDAGYTTDWPLTRTIVDGSSETVNATLVGITPAPPITVVAGQTTDITITFQVIDGAKVTFSQGTIAVAVGVNESTSTNGTSAIGAPALTASSVTVDPSMPSSLATELPSADSSGYFINDIDGLVDGSTWEQISSTTACANLSASGSSAGPSGSGFQAIINESFGGASPTFCVGDQSTNPAFFHLARSGAGNTSTFQPYCTATAPCTFYTTVEVDLSSQVFDGQTVDLSKLEQAGGSVPVIVTLVVYSQGVQWYDGQFTGQGTFSYTPQ